MCVIPRDTCRNSSIDIDFLNIFRCTDRGMFIRRQLSLAAPCNVLPPSVTIRYCQEIHGWLRDVGSTTKRFNCRTGWLNWCFIDHSHIVSIRPGWAHSQRRVGVNITIPLHWPSCEWTLTPPNFPSLCSLSAIILFQTCSNKCILYVLLFHKCIKIKYKTVNMYGVFLWLVQSSSRWNTIHSHRNYHVQLLSVWVGEFCHPARSR